MTALAGAVVYLWAAVVFSRVEKRRRVDAVTALPPDGVGQCEDCGAVLLYRRLPGGERVAVCLDCRDVVVVV